MRQGRRRSLPALPRNDLFAIVTALGLVSLITVRTVIGRAVVKDAARQGSVLHGHGRRGVVVHRRRCRGGKYREGEKTQGSRYRGNQWYLIHHGSPLVGIGLPLRQSIATDGIHYTNGL